MTALYVSQTMPCCVTGKLPSDLHHVRTRGAGGTDEPHNLMPLSRNMHRKVHDVGLSTFAVLHVEARQWLLKHGWYLEPLTNRWKHGANLA